ncbi:unnamed protein product [Scytosiphon promiscuus]
MDDGDTQPETLARNVREARQALGWSAAELAAKASIEVDIVTKLERTSECRNSELIKISQAVGITVSILIPQNDQTEVEKPMSRRMRWSPFIITAGFLLVLVKMMLPSLL